MNGQRLDIALTTAGLARSRTHARRIIDEGRARINGAPATKPSAPVPEGAQLSVTDAPEGGEYASRAAHKLAGALDALQVDPTGLRCLDAGASTGGFTDILLRRGAAEIRAVDIGHDQLLPHLAADPRVHVHDGTNLRDLDPATIGGEVDLVAADLSFISLTMVMAPLAAATRPGGQLLLMVKPQFEVGRAHLPRTGVVTDPDQRTRAIVQVALSAHENGLDLLGIGASPLPGQDGNQEYFLHLQRTHDDHAGARLALETAELAPDVYDMIRTVVRDRGVAKMRGPEHGMQRHGTQGGQR